MSKRTFGAIAGLAAAGLLLAACGGSGGDAASSSAAPESSSAETSAAPAPTTAKVGVILPDAASSARWETADRPFLEQAFQAAGVEYDIQNANGDKAKFATIADQMLASGINVLMIVNLDSPSAAAVIAKADAQGVPTIDYDRLTLGGGAQYYVSFDNVAVGTKIGEGLVTCMQDDGNDSGPVVLLNGSPTDNNATLFKEGYETVIKGAGYTVAADQSVPDWDNTKAGTIFEQIYTELGGDMVGVASANDGLGGAAIAVLERNGVAGEIPVTGQDATDEGLQRVLLGTQCMTVYKAIKAEAEAAAQLAVDLAKGEIPAADALANATVTDTETGLDVKAVLLEPISVFPENVKQVIADGFTTYDRVCTTPAIQEKCAEGGPKRPAPAAFLPDLPTSQTLRGAMTDSSAPLLSLRGINKSFGPVHVLRDVDLDVRAGRVTALVGDNGAGKSTLIKGIAGIYPFDSGTVTFEGRPVSIHGPKQANDIGIEVVYQDLALCDNLDVVHNMFLGREVKSGVTLNETTMEKRAAETLSGLSVRTLKSLRQQVSSLSGGQRQTVAIARAVLWNSKLVILDEPTAALGVAQTEQVLNLVRRLADNGLGVILISHNMNDVQAVADDIACLYLGRMAAQVERASVSAQQVVELITTGRSGDVGLQPEAAVGGAA
jgi:D-xylose transport system substrate-binding protein